MLGGEQEILPENIIHLVLAGNSMGGPPKVIKGQSRAFDVAGDIKSSRKRKARLGERNGPCSCGRASKEKMGIPWQTRTMRS